MNYGSPPFRSEIRLRRAAIFLTDETYQNSHDMEAMVRVPLDTSGLDHDFFVQKYAASGTITGPGAGDPVLANVPRGKVSQGAQYGKPTAANCYFNAQLNGNASGNAQTACGNTSVSGTMLSRYNTAPVKALAFNQLGQGCRNSSVLDASSNFYYLNLLTGSEFMAASDWGDMNTDGVIDQSIDNNLKGGAILDVEQSQGNYGPAISGTGCSAGSLLNTGTRSDCQSRYGVFDLVAYLFVMLNEREYNAVGLDNGMDGSYLGVAMQPNGSEPNNNMPNPPVYDLIRGLFLNPNLGVTLFTMPGIGFAYPVNNSNVIGQFHAGGDYNAGSRVYRDVTNAIGYTDSVTSGRCSF